MDHLVQETFLSKILAYTEQADFDVFLRRYKLTFDSVADIYPENTDPAYLLSSNVKNFTYYFKQDEDDDDISFLDALSYFKTYRINVSDSEIVSLGDHKKLSAYKMKTDEEEVNNLVMSFYGLNPSLMLESTLNLREALRILLEAKALKALNIITPDKAEHLYLYVNHGLSLNGNKLRSLYEDYTDMLEKDKDNQEQFNKDVKDTFTPRVISQLLHDNNVLSAHYDNVFSMNNVLRGMSLEDITHRIFIINNLLNLKLPSLGIDKFWN